MEDDQHSEDELCMALKYDVSVRDYYGFPTIFAMKVPGKFWVLNGWADYDQDNQYVYINSEFRQMVRKNPKATLKLVLQRLADYDVNTNH